MGCGVGDPPNAKTIKKKKRYSTFTNAAKNHSNHNQQDENQLTIEKDIFV
jgi:hypothetical protein